MAPSLRRSPNRRTVGIELSWKIVPMYAKHTMSNAVDATTGCSLHPRPRRCAWRWLLRRNPARALGLPLEELAQAMALPAGLDTRDLADTGWAVVFPEGCEPERRRALAPLLNLRREQAGCRYRELIYRPREGAGAFLARHGVAPGQGPVEPQRLPYYLLLAGDPQEIPFAVQHCLDLRYAVGRLHFPRRSGAGADDEALSRYAHTVLAVQLGNLHRGRRAALFAPRFGDLVSELISDELVPPLTAELKASCWKVDTLLAADASKHRLRDLFQVEAAPALLFAATHGLNFPPAHAQQLRRQGALVCQGWRSGEAPRGDQVLAASDLGAPAGGLVALLFACFSAGTPRQDRFSLLRQPPRLARQDFLARLPLDLLGAENGAQAVLGHVDRAWTFSFRWAEGFPLVTMFRDVVHRMLAGEPVGAAMEAIGRRTAGLAADLLDPAMREDAEALESLWTAYHDCRSFVLLGDPAIRLAAASDAEGDP